MSPEQIRSASKVDHRTDLWSLGVILYELLTGRTPYHGDARSVIAQIVSDPVRPPTALVPDLPPSLVATVMKALQKDPAKRFQSADEMRTALQGYGDFEPITSVVARLPPQSVPRRAARSAGSLPAEMVRDARTHASWETKSERRSWGKTWVLMPLAAMFLGGTAGILYYRGTTLPWSAPQTPTLAQANTTPTVTVTAPGSDPRAATAPSVAVATAAPLQPQPSGAIAASDPSALSTPPPSTTIGDVTGDAGAAAAASAPKGKPPRARPPAHAAPPAPAPPAPAPASADPPRLPKHI
jgi:serine/threonine-protein kinase